MAVFSGKICAALGWTSDGACYGVLMKAGSRKCRVVRIWRGDAYKSESIAEALEAGRQELGVGENRFLVAGGIDHVCSTVDVEVPRLKPEELRSALSFELNRVSAVPAEKLSWGYRVLSNKGGQAKLRIRLYFMRQSVWEAWIQTVSALRQGIDALIPPVAVLDPLLEEDAFFLQNPGGENGFVLAPSGDGARTITVSDKVPDGAFGAGQTPLSLPFLNPGPLDELSVEEQRRFAPVVLLAMYALTKAFHSDQETILSVPYELRPKRHRLSRMLAAVLLCYVVAMAVTGGVREYTARKAVMDGLLMERAAVEEQVKEEQAGIRSDTADFVEVLEKEMSEAYVERPTLPVALLELTRLVDGEGWCQFFDWKDGNITVQLHEETEDEELVRSLELSPVIGDVIQISKAVAADTTVSRKFEMTARFDLDGEYRPPAPKVVEKTTGEKDGSETDESVQGSDDVDVPEPDVVPQTEARPEEEISVPPPPPPPMSVVPESVERNQDEPGENATQPGDE